MLESVRGYTPDAAAVAVCVGGYHAYLSFALLCLGLLQLLDLTSHPPELLLVRRRLASQSATARTGRRHFGVGFGREKYVQRWDAGECGAHMRRVA